MPDGWSYGLSDFLMFSPQAYWRLVARHNAAWWPAQLAAGAAAVAIVALLWRQHARAVLVLLALAWAWVGWAFHLRRYSEIFLAAPWFAGAFLLQALLLALVACLPQRQRAPQRPAGPALAVAGVACAWPLLAPLTGHPWSEAEVFGLLPDPTALLTLAALVALRAPPRWQRVLLAVLPALSLLVGAATRWLLAQ